MSFSIPNYSQDHSRVASLLQAFEITTIQEEANTDVESESLEPAILSNQQALENEEVLKDTSKDPVSHGVLQSVEAAYLEGKISREIQEANDFHSTLVLKTSDIHKLAVKSPFLQSLLKASFCPTQFTKYLINLQNIHYHLENVQKKISPDSPTSRFVFRELWKFTDLEEDIAVWKSYAHGASLEHDNIAKSTKEYVGHLESISEKDPDVLVAHLWVFYGTLLSGGQMIGRSIKRVYEENVDQKGLSISKENEGAQFFQFPFNIASFKKDRWYPALNSVYDGIKDESKPLFCDNVVQESNTAFKAVLDFVEEIRLGSC
jgi:heme oxygenase